MSIESPTAEAKVQQVISGIRNLPTPPIVFHQIQKVVNDHNASAAQVAAVLAEDPAMSVKVLKLTNSAFYGLAREVDSVKQAVVIVGMEAIKNLVLSASVLDMFKGDSTLDSEFQEEFWRHSLATAFCCRLLARRINSRGIVDPDTGFASGLLHDVGKMIICCYLPRQHTQIRIERQNRPDATNSDVELLVLQCTHEQIGAALASQWKLPSKLANAIEYHHKPLECEGPEPVAHLVHVANYLAKKTFLDRQEEHLIGSLAPGIMEYLALEPSDLDHFCEQLREDYSKAETFMQMAGINAA
ncbi:MAG: HDOD domain-containing protein [bacterium]